MSKRIDIVVDLALGDSGKGKLVHHLLKSYPKYTHCIRYNGSCNAGHSIYHNDQKYITHQLPAGFFFDIKSIIGPGCVVLPEQFFKEMLEFSDAGFDVFNFVKIAHNTHIITRAQLEEDRLDTKIGTTKRGNGPCYRDKAARIGIRSENLSELADYLIDIYDEFYVKNRNYKILMEGAQGFGLDIDHGDYPYVTSSSCTVASALQNGFSFSCLDRVFGVIKSYVTYVGSKKFQPEGEEYNLIGDLGKEIGATTNRKRQVDYNRLKDIRKAVLMNGVTDLIVNKMDILQQLNLWKVYNEENVLINLKTEKNFKDYITYFAKTNGIERIFFSYSPFEV